MDSTVGELFGALVAVLAGSATAELQQEPLLVKLDNKGVVEHFRAMMGGLETRMRRGHHYRRRDESVAAGGSVAG